MSKNKSFQGKQGGRGKSIVNLWTQDNLYFSVATSIVIAIATSMFIHPNRSKVPNNKRHDCITQHRSCLYTNTTAKKLLLFFSFYSGHLHKHISLMKESHIYIFVVVCLNVVPGITTVSGFNYCTKFTCC